MSRVGTRSERAGTVPRGRTSSVAPAFAGRDMRRARVTERFTLASGPDPRCISGRPLGGREATRGKGARAGPAIVRLAARAPRDLVDPDGGLRELVAGDVAGGEIDELLVRGVRPRAELHDSGHLFAEALVGRAA